MAHNHENGTEVPGEWTEQRNVEQMMAALPGAR
jgi:hypothetical protein